MPVSAAVAAARQARYDRRMEGAKLTVPSGPYCYSYTGNMRSIERDGQTISIPETKVCPHWKLRKDKPEQTNGYCRLLKAGDWQSSHTGGTLLLFDQVKECGINKDDEMIEWPDEPINMFEPVRPLSETTVKRIATGVIKLLDSTPEFAALELSVRNGGCTD